MNVTDPDTLYNDTSIKVGNAMAFCKGIDANGYFEYVPHIAFRGTKAQWKALAYGADDWIFSNAENQVVVHCSDGVLEY